MGLCNTNKMEDKEGWFQYSTKKTLARIRMGKTLSRINDGEAFLILGIILLKSRLKDTYTNGLGSTPHIGGKTNTKRITGTEKYYTEAEK